MSSKRTDLASLLGEVGVDEPQPASQILLDDLAANPDNPRGDIDVEDPDFVGLKNSIASIGVAQALTVCTREAYLQHHPQHTDTLTAPYVVVAGHRRLVAAQMAGCKKVPALVNDAAAENPLMWAVAENLQRVGLNPMQEARTLSVLTEKPPAGKGLSQTTVANGIGKSQAFVSQRIALLKLTPELQDKVLAGELKVKRAVLLAKLKADEQERAEQQLQNLVPELQAEVDGGKLNDIHLALKVAALPGYRQYEARLNGGVPPKPRPTSAPTSSAPAAEPPTEGGDSATTDTGGRAAIPSQGSVSPPVSAAGNGFSSEEPPPPPMISLHDVTQIADDLALHLSAQQLAELAELLLARSTAR